jgi:hypothetical protein
MVFATGSTLKCERLAAYNEILILAFPAKLIKPDEVDMGVMGWKKFGGNVLVVAR